MCAGGSTPTRLGRAVSEGLVPAPNPAGAAGKLHSGRKPAWRRSRDEPPPPFLQQSTFILIEKLGPVTWGSASRGN